MFGLDDLLGPLFGFLKCLVLFAVGCVEWVLFAIVNAVIAAVAGLMSVVLSILPTVSLPSVTLPSSFVLANYLLPLDQVLLAMGLIGTVALGWPICRLLLGWLREQ